ncbi:uncharacterized protein LOC106174294 [Lingula anatina]|uniref:Uncharacterized protein LOC106174294 n=1 Tax=Lingula anatina TaxID=7574 RepID=A0A1S3JLI5_LINAN|nr:uncharacterized protein LOC106174294 [Lingula anatina]|eukprot:XP_013411243.1 uncharacterized protein LOC106174294 [Lingula anatina]
MEDKENDADFDELFQKVGEKLGLLKLDNLDVAIEELEQKVKSKKKVKASTKKTRKSKKSGSASTEIASQSSANHSSNSEAPPNRDKELNGDKNRNPKKTSCKAKKDLRGENENVLSEKEEKYQDISPVDHYIRVNDKLKSSVKSTRAKFDVQETRPFLVSSFQDASDECIPASFDPKVEISSKCVEDSISSETGCSKSDVSNKSNHSSMNSETESTTQKLWIKSEETSLTSDGESFGPDISDKNIQASLNSEVESCTTDHSNNTDQNVLNSESETSAHCDIASNSAIQAPQDSEENDLHWSSETKGQNSKTGSSLCDTSNKNIQASLTSEGHSCTHDSSNSCDGLSLNAEDEKISVSNVVGKEEPLVSGLNDDLSSHNDKNSSESSISAQELSIEDKSLQVSLNSTQSDLSEKQETEMADGDLPASVHSELGFVTADSLTSADSVGNESKQKQVSVEDEAPSELCAAKTPLSAITEITSIDNQNSSTNGEKCQALYDSIIPTDLSETPELVASGSSSNESFDNSEPVDPNVKLSSTVRDSTSSVEGSLNLSPIDHQSDDQSGNCKDEKDQAQGESLDDMFSQMASKLGWLADGDLDSAIQELEAKVRGKKCSKLTTKKKGNKSKSKSTSLKESMNSANQDTTSQSCDFKAPSTVQDKRSKKSKKATSAKTTGKVHKLRKRTKKEEEHSELPLACQLFPQSKKIAVDDEEDVKMELDSTENGPHASESQGNRATLESTCKTDKSLQVSLCSENERGNSSEDSSINCIPDTLQPKNDRARSVQDQSEDFIPDSLAPKEEGTTSLLSTSKEMVPDTLQSKNGSFTIPGDSSAKFVQDSFCSEDVDSSKINNDMGVQESLDLEHIISSDDGNQKYKLDLNRYNPNESSHHDSDTQDAGKIPESSTKSSDKLDFNGVDMGQHLASHFNRRKPRVSVYHDALDVVPPTYSSEASSNEENTFQDAFDTVTGDPEKGHGDSETNGMKQENDNCVTDDKGLDNENSVTDDKEWENDDKGSRNTILEISPNEFVGSTSGKAVKLDLNRLKGGQQKRNLGHVSDVSSDNSSPCEKSVSSISDSFENLKIPKRDKEKVRPHEALNPHLKKKQSKYNKISDDSDTGMVLTDDESDNNLDDVSSGVDRISGLDNNENNVDGEQNEFQDAVHMDSRKEELKHVEEKASSKADDLSDLSESDLSSVSLQEPTTNKITSVTQNSTQDTPKCAVRARRSRTVHHDSASSDDEALESFFSKMKTPVKPKHVSQASLEEFIISDSDMSRDSDDSTFYNYTDSLLNRITSRSTGKGKRKTTSKVSEDLEVFKTPLSDVTSGIQNKSSPQSEGSEDVFKTPSVIPRKPKILAKTSFIPRTLQQSTEAKIRPQSTDGQPRHLSFLKSLSPDVAEHKRDPEARKFVSNFQLQKKSLTTMLYKLYNSTVFEDKN